MKTCFLVLLIALCIAFACWSVPPVGDAAGQPMPAVVLIPLGNCQSDTCS
jgi:hypothetical protein